MDSFTRLHKTLLIHPNLRSDHLSLQICTLLQTSALNSTHKITEYKQAEKCPQDSGDQENINSWCADHFNVKVYV